jgi:hypothetical protein
MHLFRVLAIYTCLISLAIAHEGHGLEGAHSHPNDVWGFLALGLAVGLAVWFSRKK